jgi:hypothetical protein
MPTLTPAEPEAAEPNPIVIAQLSLASASAATAAPAIEAHEPTRPNSVEEPAHGHAEASPTTTHATLSPTTTTQPPPSTTQERAVTSLAGAGGPVHASVVLDHMSGGASKASVRAAINHGAIERCYRLGTTALSGTAKLEVSTNMSGRIVSAEVSDSTLPGNVRSCIEQVARSGQIRDADVGQVHATFSLTVEH